MISKADPDWVPDAGTMNYLDWIVHEVEKPGSWHTTVGHGNSMSSKRHEFDLEMLHKDLVVYGHDPHTHYYLGITNQAMVQKAQQDGQSLNTPEIQRYLHQALHYLQLRVNSQYKDEFVEERWACMYMLGLTYANLQRDLTKSEYWLSMCRDYNPGQSECGIAMSKIFLANGAFEPALRETERVLRTQNEERDMLSHFKNYACELPELVLTLFQQKAYMGQFGSGDVKYMLLMLQMRKDPVCDGADKMQLSTEITEAMARVLREEGATNKRAISLESSARSLCQDDGLQQYLSSSRYLLHPCDEFRVKQASTAMCQIFTYNLPPANEEMQSTSPAKEFVGAGQLLDVIHLVHGGHSKPVFRADRPYRLLFAEHFNPKALFNLVGFFDRVEFSNYHIHVALSDASSIDSIRETLSVCAGTLKSKGALAITYEQTELTPYLRTAANKLRSMSSFSSQSARFDYIEYSGGVSVETQHPEQLVLMREILTDEGVLGLTYFAKNHHVDKIRRFMETKNTSAMPPFSLETGRLVRSYLDLHKMPFLKDDAALVTFLGGEPVKRKHPPAYLSDVVPNVKWRAFSQSEVLSAAQSAGLKAVAWVPSAYAHPFDELGHYEVKKFWAAGMTQEHFVENYMTFFRYSVYLQRADATSPGRAKMTKDVLTNQSFARSIQVLDRTGSLGISFSGIGRRAEQRLSTSFAFAPYSIKGEFSLDYQVLPAVSPCLAELSSGASVADLHKVNVDFAVQHKQVVDQDALRDLLLHLLNYLETINVITYLSNAGPLSTRQDSAVLAAKSPLPQSDKGTVRQVGGLKMRFPDSKSSATAQSTSPVESKPTVPQTGGAPQKVGGLNIRFKDKAEAPVSGSVSSDKVSAPQKIVSDVKTTPQKHTLNVGHKVSPEMSTRQEQEKPSELLSPDTQITRMRALGLSEDLIADTLRSATSRIDPKTTVVTSSGSSSEPVGDIKSKLRDILQILTSEALDDSSGPVVTASMPETLLPPPNVETRQSNMAGGLLKNRQIAQGLKLKVDSQQAKPEEDQSSGRKHEAVPVPVVASAPRVPTNPDTLALLGLKQRLMLNNAHKASAEKATLVSAANIPTKRTEISSVSTAEVESVKVPATQSASALQSSFRRTECFYLSHERGPLPSNCVQTTPVKRRTAALDATSLAKMSFESAQLRHLVATDVLANRAMANQLLNEYGRVAEYFRARQWTDKYKVARLTNADVQISKAIPALNRAVHISEEDADVEDLTHRGAISYLQGVATTADADRSDFMVVDVLLKDDALRQMSTALLTSTVWFDATNGICFVAHSDDGLVLPSVKVLAQQIGFALSSPGKKMRVVRYYAVAMSLDQAGGASPVAMGKTHETVVVLWLNPSAAAPETEEQTTSASEDGLRIFDEYAASKLFSQGVSEYPNVHSEFMSKSGDLAVAMPPRNNQTTSELVARRANRLVIIKGKRPFTFSVLVTDRNDD
eukprot:gene23136-29329_t